MRIFHRIDDVKLSSPEMVKVMEFFAETVKEFVVAAIPCGFSSKLACRIREYNNCTVYQHGYKHINRVPCGWCDEFPDAFPIQEARKMILTGKYRLEDLFQRKITGYVPPWNNTSENALQILSELGFKCYSAQKNHTKPFWVNRDIDIDIVASYAPGIVYKPLEKVLRQVKDLAQGSSEIGILYHFKGASIECLAQIFDFVREIESMQDGYELVGGRA